jgi:hypothetical protein
VPAGGNFSVWVNISYVNRLALAQYDITYNPGVLAVTSVTGGSINGSGFPLDGWSFPDGVQGRIRIINNVPGMGTSVTGSGYMARVYFHVNGSPGTNSTIKLSNGKLAKSSGTEIPANWIGDSVLVVN